MVIAPLVIDLGLLLMFLVALALCLLCVKFVEALLGGLGGIVAHIPLVGSVSRAALHRAEQRVTHALGSVAASLEGRIGALYHSAAGLVRTFGQKMADAFELIAALTALLATLASWKSVLALYHSLVGQTRAHVVKSDAHTKVIHKTTVVVKHVDTKVNTQIVKSQAIPADVVVPGDLAGLRGQVRAAEDSLGRLWDRVRGIALPSVRTIGVAAVAVALGRLGLGSLRCNNVTKFNKRLCGMNPTALEGLLADALLIVGSVSLIEFIRDAQAVEGVALDALGAFIREMPRV